jgi:hypothetical protein
MKKTVILLYKDRDSSVGIATRLRTGLSEQSGFDSRRGLWIFLFATASRPALGPTQPPIQWVSGILSPGVKRPRRETDHSPPSSAEVKNTWIFTSTPPYAFTAWCLVNHTDKFTFTFIARGFVSAIYNPVQWGTKWNMRPSVWSRPTS